jgi:hypothetical protein
VFFLWRSAFEPGFAARLNAEILGSPRIVLCLGRDFSFGFVCIGVGKHPDKVCFSMFAPKDQGLDMVQMAFVIGTHRSMTERADGEVVCATLTTPDSKLDARWNLGVMVF